MSSTETNNNNTSPKATDTADKSVRPKDDVELITNLQSELNKHKVREALESLQKWVIAEFNTRDTSIIWDLVPIICQRLRGLSEFRFKTFKYCQQMLLELAEVTNPREMIIVFLSELENDLCLMRKKTCKTEEGEEDEEEEDNDFEITDHNCFKAMIKPVEKVLLMMPKKRNESLKSVLLAFDDHISHMSVSPLLNFDLVNGKRDELLNDINILGLHSVIYHYVDFIETFVQEVDIHHKHGEEQIFRSFDPQVQRTLLLRTLLRLLNHPLKHMDFAPTLGPLKKTTETTTTPYFFRQDEISLEGISLKIVRLLSCLHSNFYTLPSRTDLITSEEEKMSANFNDMILTKEGFETGISVAAYLLSIQPHQRPTNFQPLVFTHSHNLFSQLSFIHNLLNNTTFFVYDKGLELLENLLLNIPKQTMEARFLDLLRAHPIDMDLVSIMVYSQSPDARNRALCLFRHLVIALDSYGRYKFLRQLLSQPKQHTGFQAVVVQTYKDLLFYDELFQKTNLQKMLRIIISAALPDDQETDILANNDLLFASLNLLIYILKGDPKTENTTKIWDYLDGVQDTFLKPLQSALNLNLETYKHRLSNLKDLKAIEAAKTAALARKKGGKKSNAKTTKPGGEIELDVKVCNDSNILSPPPEMTIDQEHDVILMAIQNMDMLQFLLERIDTIILENSTTQ